MLTCLIREKQVGALEKYYQKYSSHRFNPLIKNPRRKQRGIEDFLC